MINYELSFLIAVLSVVYTNLLTDTNMIFNGLLNYLHKFFKIDERERAGKPYHPLYMILIFCEKCNSGQIAFWLFIYIHRNIYLKYPFECFLRHFFFVSFTILLAFTINGIVNIIKHKQKND